MSITQGGEYVAYANGYLSVLQRFDQTTKEIVVEVTDKAGLTYTETFEITMEERPTDPTPPSQDDAPSDEAPETPEDTPPPQDVDPNRDSDGDGVPDSSDDYPDNPFFAKSRDYQPSLTFIQTLPRRRKNMAQIFAYKKN